MPTPPLPNNVAARSNCARLLDEALSPGDDAVGDGRGQLRRAELPFLAESDDDHRLGPRHGERVVAIDRPVDEDLIRARPIGILPEPHELVHRTADKLVHHPLGSGQRHRPVVPEDDGLTDELEVPVDDRDGQRRTGDANHHRQRRDCAERHGG